MCGKRDRNAATVARCFCRCAYSAISNAMTTAAATDSQNMRLALLQLVPDLGKQIDFARTGRMVRLRHSSGYESYYLHLSAFAPGIKAGASISQGEMVGRVGATGLATGPHLHYGLKKNGVFVNPLIEHRNLPPGEPVPPSPTRPPERVAR